MALQKKHPRGLISCQDLLNRRVLDRTILHRNSIVSVSLFGEPVGGRRLWGLGEAVKVWLDGRSVNQEEFVTGATSVETGSTGFDG